ncbi:unnamed protein product, partial [Rhizoctonia solani]
SHILDISLLPVITSGAFTAKRVCTQLVVLSATQSKSSEGYPSTKAQVPRNLRNRRFTKMEMYHELNEIDKNIQSLNRALSQTADDHSSMPLLLARLGSAHDTRFGLLNELDDLEKAIEYETNALAMTPDNDPGLPELLFDLAGVHGQRFQRLGDLHDIEKAIEYGHISVELATDNSALALRMTNLGICHSIRFSKLGEVTDLEDAIQYQSHALALTPDGHADLPRRLANLGTSFSRRYERLGELNDMENAIKYESRAITLTPDGHPSLPDKLANLGASHLRRYVRLGKLSDLENAIDYESRALALTPQRHPNLPITLANLGVSHICRFEHLGELSDLENAIEYDSRAVLMTPNSHTDMPSRLSNLAASEIRRFERLGELKDLQNAIELQSRALALTPDGHSDLPGRLRHLGLFHRSRFLHLGELSDIENAIEYQTRALALTPDGHPHMPANLTELGLSQIRRYECLGGLSDLENAIEYQSRALALTPDGDPNFPSRLANLGVSHSRRFEHLGELKDLEDAIEYQSRALASTPDGHPDLPHRLANLGAYLSRRYERLSELKDLEDAIEYESRALALTPNGHPDLPSRLANLGVSHSVRFRRLGELKDLENAIEYESRALIMTPDEHPDLPRRLTNLAVSHKCRFQQLSDLSDLEHAMRYESRALALTPDNYLDVSGWQSSHAKTHLHYYQLTRDDTHLQHSVDLFRSASKSLSGAPRDKFRYAQSWAKTASKHSHGSCIEAYQTVIDLLPQFIWLGATTNQRYEDLLMTEALAVDAAYAAIRSSDYSLALEWLEHARCVVWNQSLMLRSPLDKLQSIYPDIGTRLQTVAGQLRSAASESRESRALTSGSMTPEQAAREHRRLAKEYDDLLVQIRKLPGFSDFLRPMKPAGLVQTARAGPIVVINCHKDSCDALVVLPGEQTVGHVALPNFSAQKAQEARQTLESSLRSKGIRQRGVKVRQEPGHREDMSSVLATLWHDVIKPILDYLGYMNNHSSVSMPHITWCPTDALSFLPLHAAGDYSQPRSRVFDYVVSSYTPTLTAMLTSSPDLSSTSCRLVAVGQANTPGQSPLPGTVRELAYVRAHITNSSQYSQLIGSDGTVAAVLDAMEKHDWVHLACHAHQNVSDPTKSGFFLHDGILDLAEINRRSFKGKGLAFLSACQTATGDERLADEAVHLASGMLMAGYASVIATMWSVHDADAPVVADNVYAELMKDRKIDNGEAGRALHNAVATLRERVGEENFERWVPYIHIGS